MNQREVLPLNYITIIGQNRDTDAGLIKRTWAQLEAWSHRPLPGASRPLLDSKSSWGERWLRVFMAYESDSQLWTKLLKMEVQHDPQFMLFFWERAEDVRVRFARRIFRRAEALRAACEVFPEIYGKIHDYDLGHDPEFNRTVDKVPNPGLSRASKVKCAKLGFHYLEEAREKLRVRDYGGSFYMFVLGKRQFVDIVKPSDRWYMNGPWNMASNRATAGDALEAWPAALYDTRFTLLLTPDHVRSYERLPKIAAAFFASELEIKLRDLVVEVKRKPKRPMGEWRKLAARAIGLLSIPAVIYSRIGKLTEEKIQELIRVGIDDMYEPISVGPDVIETPSWLKDEDLEGM
jgi:hypothetical protein